MKLVLDCTIMNTQDKREVAEEARKVWAQHYGDARIHVRERLDAGSSKSKEKTEPASEIQWLRQRRTSTSSGAGTSARKDSEMIDVDSDNEFITEKHRKEINFNEKKAAFKKFEALKVNQLLAKEKTEEFMEFAAVRAGQVAKRDKERLREDRRLQLPESSAGPSAECLRGLPVFVEPDVSSAELQQALQRLEMTVADTRSAAQA